MTNQFDSYEGFKIACLTCSRTLNEIDGIEVSSKLLWSILAMYQAIIYAMLSNKEIWTVEENPDYNNDLLNSITKSAQAIREAGGTEVAKYCLYKDQLAASSEK